MWNHKRFQTAQTILTKKNNAGGITIPDIETHYRAVTIKTMWYWNKTRHVDQWNKTESMCRCNSSHLILDKDAKNIS